LPDPVIPVALTVLVAAVIVWSTILALAAGTMMIYPL
jgi:hypothetical protein